MLAAMCLALGLAGCRAPSAGNPAPTEQSGAGKTLAIVGARIYTSPTEAPITDGVVVMTGATISAVGRRDQVRVPAQAAVLDGTGLTVTAGFWNAHVHFIDAVFGSAASRPAP